MKTKGELRAEMRGKRRALAPTARIAANRAVCAALLGRDDVKAAFAAHRPVAVYLASADELDLSDFITVALARGAVLAAPRWNGEAYELAALDSLDGLIAGPHGILEPPPSPVAAPSVWLVPGLVFTRQGGRLGHGGGWYDRLLSAADPQAVKIGVGYACQLVDALPTEPHDIPLDAIVTA